MAEHDADRDEGREPDERGAPYDEEAAWAAIVAGYGEEPPDPPGVKPFTSVEDLPLLEAEHNGPTPADADTDGDTDADRDDEDSPDTRKRPGGADRSNRSLGSSLSFAPGVGPRDHVAPEPSDDDFDADDEGHFVPPEPPPLPAADTTAKFAWLAVVGGPVLLLLAVLLGWDMTWWLATVGIGGFLGGFATLVVRMKDDEDGDDPGRGAVV